ncbi:MAG: hypothetical protein FWD94_04685, partial [Treponema sp.]|nr:hypothetical protein [Treponema sp.]
ADRQHKEFEKRQKEFEQRHKEFEQRSKEFEQRSKEFEQRQQKEFEQRQKEFEQGNKEFEKRLKETERMIKENGKQIGGLHNRFGELAEHLVGPGIVRSFAKMGLHFSAGTDRGKKLYDKDGIVKAEIDMILENEHTIMAIEVKAKPDSDGKDVEEHIRRIAILREHLDSLGRKPKTILGAMAGAVFGLSAKRASIKAGLYVIEQSGDTMRIDVPENFVPREW